MSLNVNMNSRENAMYTSAAATKDRDFDQQSRVSVESRRSHMSRMTTNTMDAPMNIPAIPPLLPETTFDSSLSFETIIAELAPSLEDIDPKKKEQMEKRQSNVLRLAEENEKLNAELKAMTERLAAAEKRTQAILAARERQQRQQKEKMEMNKDNRAGASGMPMQYQSGVGQRF